jgi:hypothetical protein
VLRSASARVIATVVTSGWAIPTYAQPGPTGGAASGAALLILVASLAVLLVPRTPRARFVTRAVRARGGK